jgi:drug/metabolite transporter (DMT)-like permease
MRRGLYILILAELCFASATVFAKFVTNSSDIPAIEITFCRLILGVILATLYMLKTNTSFIPKKIPLVVARAILSFSALITFFYSVEHSSVTNANMLNMTYPVFIFIVAPLFRLEKLHKISLLFLVMAMTGIYFVIFPDFSHINRGDIIGLFSGIFGAFSIITLSIAREHDSTVLIVFYLMAIGTVINVFMMAPVFVMPHAIDLPYLIASGLAGVAGQVFLTMGYKHVTAKAGSMVSSSRIIFAAAMGWAFFAEPLSFRILAGGFLIIASIIGISALRNKTMETVTTEE